MKVRRKNIIIIAFFIITITLFIAIISYLIPDKDKKKVYKISYISASTKEKNLKFISEGISRAAKDMNAEVTMHKLLPGKEVENQISLLKKEVEKNVDVILISPIDYEKLAKPIEEANEKVPIILINSKIDSNKKLPYISCNNYGLGINLAEEVLQRGNTRKRILIVKENINISNLNEMEDGFRDELKNSKNSLLELKLKENSDNYYNQILSFIKENNVDIIVSFNENVIEAAAKLKKDLYKENEKYKFELYGASKANEIVSYVEEGIIDGLAIENEFNIGYLGTEMAIKKITNEKIEEKEIRYTVINKRNMYLEENQKLIFPFIK